MSFTGRVIVISMNGKYRDGDIDVFILVIDMVESAIAVSELPRVDSKFQLLLTQRTARLHRSASRSHTACRHSSSASDCA